MIHRVLGVACIGISASSCIPIGADSAVRLRVEAVDQSGGRFDQCKLTLMSEGGDALQSTMVSGDFLTTFVIEPKLRTYYVTAACAGAKTGIKSATFQAGHYAQYEKPVDLGRLTVPR